MVTICALRAMQISPLMILLVNLSVETHALVDLVGTLESTCSTRLMTNFVSNLSLRFSIMNVFDFLQLTSIAPKFMSLIGDMLYLLHTHRSLLCADITLRIYSLTHSLSHICCHACCRFQWSTIHQHVLKWHQFKLRCNKCWVTSSNSCTWLLTRNLHTGNIWVINCQLL